MSSDPCRNYSGPADTSRAAWESLPGATRRLQRERVAEYVRRADRSGATCDEIEASLIISHQTVSARLTELRQEGVILDSSRRRKTRSGRTARVYVHAEIWRQCGLLAGVPTPLETL